MRCTAAVASLRMLVTSPALAQSTGQAMLLKVGTVIVVATAEPGEDGLWEACYALHSGWRGLGQSLLSCTVGGFDCERWALHFAVGEGVGRARCEAGCADAPVKVLLPD